MIAGWMPDGVLALLRAARTRGSWQRSWLSAAWQLWRALVCGEQFHLVNGDLV